MNKRCSATREVAWWPYVTQCRWDEHNEDVDHMDQRGDRWPVTREDERVRG